MPTRHVKEEDTETRSGGILKHFQPYTHLAAMACTVIVWSYSTFALRDTVQELKIAQTQMEERLKVEQAHLEARCQDYSDRNRIRMEDKYGTFIVDIKEQLNILRSLILRKRGD